MLPGGGRLSTLDTKITSETRLSLLSPLSLLHPFVPFPLHFSNLSLHFPSVRAALDGYGPEAARR